MPRSDRELISRWWSDAWNEGLWAGSWQKSLDGLSPEQANWSPAPGRHSIWQIVLHMCFWREHWLRRVSTDPLGPRPTADQISAGNFPAVEDPSARAWALARERFEATQQRLGATLRDPAARVDELFYFLPHDVYHFGQISLLRALQGLPHIE